MKTTLGPRMLLVWLLYCSVLISSLACSFGHGQMAGMAHDQLSGDSLSESHSSHDRGLSMPMGNATGSDCAMSASHSAILLCALFGLLGLLPWPGRIGAALAGPYGRSVRHRWPSANPRASPLLA